MAVGDPADQRAVAAPEVRILNQVEGAAGRVWPRDEREPLGLLSVPHPQHVLGCALGDLSRRILDLLLGSRPAVFAPEHAGHRVEPEVRALQLLNAGRVGSQSQAEVVDQEGAAEHVRLSRGDGVIVAGDQVCHLPERVDVRDIVDREVGEVTTDLGSQRGGSLSEALEAGTQASAVALFRVARPLGQRSVPEIRVRVPGHRLSLC
ncbi:MAG: hypothetical protein AAGI08_00025 [Bacteroidota bacterium]